MTTPVIGMNKPLTKEQIKAEFLRAEQESRGSMDKKLALTFTLSQIGAALLQGIANATETCINNSQGEIMCIPNQMGGKTGETTDKDSLGAGMLNAGEDIIKTARNLSLHIFTEFFPMVLDVVAGKYANMSADEAAAPMIDDLNAQAEMFEKLAKNKQFQEALKEWAEAHATVGIQAIVLSQPAIDIILENFWDATNKAMVKSAIGLINTGMNVTEAALGEIPVIGGFIALCMAFIRGINQGMLAVAPAVQATTANTVIAGETAKQLGVTLTPELGDATKSTEKLTSYTSPVSSVSPPEMRTEQAGINLGAQLGDHLRKLSLRAQSHAAALHEKATKQGGWIDQAQGHVTKVTDQVKEAAADIQAKAKEHQKTAQDLATAAKEAQTNPTMAATRLAVNNPRAALTAAQVAAKVATGGARRTRNKLKRKITRATRRLERSLARFTRRRKAQKKKRRRTRNRR